MNRSWPCHRKFYLEMLPIPIFLIVCLSDEHEETKKHQTMATIFFFIFWRRFKAANNNRSVRQALIFSCFSVILFELKVLAFIFLCQKAFWEIIYSINSNVCEVGFSEFCRD